MKNVTPLRHWTLASLGFLIISVNAAYAQTATRLELPRFQKDSLLNGFEVLFVEAGAEPGNFLFMLRNGAAFDPVGKWGATLLMTRMMLHSTEGRDEEQLRFALRRYGARVEARVGYDAVFFLGQAPPGTLGEVLDVLSDIVTRPAFEEETFLRLRDELIDERRRQSQSPAERTQNILAEEIFLPHPYGRPVEGTTESLSSLTVNDIKIQYRRLFMPNQAQLAIGFQGDRERLFRTLSRSWGGWVRDDALPFTFRHARRRGGKVVIVDVPSSEGLMRWGLLGVSRSDTTYHALKVLEHYLLLGLPDWAGDVEKGNQIQGAPRVEARRAPGFVEVSIRAPVQHLPDYYRRLRSELSSVMAGEIDADRLAEAKRLALREFTTALQGSMTQLQTLLEMQLYEIGAGYVTTYGMRINRVTSDRLKSALTGLSPLQNSVLVVSGPSGRLDEHLAEFGTPEIREFGH